MKQAFGSWNKFYTALNGSWENENSVPQRYTENVFIFGHKFLTYNVTIPSLRTTGISKSSVISVHSCDFSLEYKCNIFNWPTCRSTGSISPSLSVNGTLVFAGSDSFTSCEHEKWIMLSASWSSSLEKRQSHQTVEWIKCAFDGQ